MAEDQAERVQRRAVHLDGGLPELGIGFGEARDGWAHPAERPAWLAHKGLASGLSLPGEAFPGGLSQAATHRVSLLQVSEACGFAGPRKMLASGAEVKRFLATRKPEAICGRTRYLRSVWGFGHMLLVPTATTRRKGGNLGVCLTASPLPIVAQPACPHNNNNWGGGDS